MTGTKNLFLSVRRSNADGSEFAVANSNTFDLIFKANPNVCEFDSATLVSKIDSQFEYEKMVKKISIWII